MSYKPFTTKYTWQIIDDIKEYLEETNEDQTTLDTLDLCHLIGEIERLNNNWNKLEEWLKDKDKNALQDDNYWEVLDKLQELKGSKEPSFEEMVGFVENVCKDIKSQPTLHEELEEERKRIAKIVGDFKEVNK